MGTRADFYVGRGSGAEWLGSIAFDGYPAGIDSQIVHCESEAAYRHAVDRFLTRRDDATRPSDGWPWPWSDSSTTDYAYAFDEGHVLGSCFGSPWFDAREAEPEEIEGEPASHPDMSQKKNVTYGPRSGLLIL